MITRIIYDENLLTTCFWSIYTRKNCPIAIGIRTRTRPEIDVTAKRDDWKSFTVHYFMLRTLSTWS